MAQFNYHCRKNGLSYLLETPATFTTTQDAYAWRKGVNEYMDNYHAELVWKKRDGTMFTGTKAEFDAKVDGYCIEARNRFHAGDVPTARGEYRPAIDPKVVAIGTEAVAAGVAGMTPETWAGLAAILGNPEGVAALTKLAAKMKAAA